MAGTTACMRVNIVSKANKRAEGLEGDVAQDAGTEDRKWIPTMV